jgi:ankyrin repeat protein
MKRYVGSLTSAWLILSALTLSGATDPKLFDAIQNRDQKAVLALLKRGTDVNSPRPDGSTPLAWAAMRDDAEIVAALIKAGANVNTADENGETPLTLAAANGNLAIARMLIDAKANINAARWTGDTPLMIGAQAGNAELVRLLLDKGAPIDIRESRMGQTALMWAAAEGKADVVQLLTERGADVKAVSKNGFTPLLFAAQSGSAPAVKALIAAKADPNAKSPSGAGAFTLALARGHEDVARIMLDYNVDVNAKDRTGSTPLHEAVRLGKAGLVRDLVKRGANLEALTARPSGFGSPFRIGELTPFLVAAENGSVPMMKLLVELGANPKARNTDGVGAVTLAVTSRKQEALEYTGTLGLDVNEIRKGVGTPLHFAIRFGDAAMVEYLVNKGADITVKDRNGRTPMEAVDFDAPKPLAAKLKKIMQEKSAK